MTGESPGWAGESLGDAFRACLPRGLTGPGAPSPDCAAVPAASATSRPSLVSEGAVGSADTESSRGTARSGIVSLTCFTRRSTESSPPDARDVRAIDDRDVDPVEFSAVDRLDVGEADTAPLLDGGAPVLSPEGPAEAAAPGESAGVADAAHGVVSSAVPMPRATASPPTRPMYLPWFMVVPFTNRCFRTARRTSAPDTGNDARFTTVLCGDDPDTRRRRERQ
ncbi:hypothetical protein MCHLDSM_06938 [Mycolicibacterium chlorophenolicum]|uniref:Uncharacterized protein n=1 Tax=Mycolicibacterium chlorophenolicum TaxID=37916 RepID=A0A0J6V9X0_9MYCO|nr:hypothetical protein MCHLDSM_06938 [Mycolicibacterium chlorophenolicum]